MNHFTESQPSASLSGHTQALRETGFPRSNLALKRKLEEAVSLLEATLDATHDGILVVDREGRIVRFNKRFPELWRVPESVLRSGDDSLVLQSVLAQLHDPEAFLTRVNELYSKPEEESVDELQFKDGRTFERYSRPQFVDGEIWGRVWSFRDITLQKKAENKLKDLLECEHRLRIETEKNLQLREDFLSIASHELRTPLTPLSLHLQILQRFLKRPEVAHVPDCDKQLDLMTRALSQVTRITRLVEDLLDVSRISTGRLSLYPERIDLPQLIKEVTDRYADQLQSHQCELRLDLPERLPGQWDRLRVEQVVTNLLTNAMKFGGGKPIEISARARQDEVEVRVRDHGIGISLEDQKRVFNRFERAVSQRHYGGLGLGLYIVHQIIEGHGGKIEIESRPGEGSTFIVRLPRSSPVADPRSITLHTAPQPC